MLPDTSIGDSKAKVLFQLHIRRHTLSIHPASLSEHVSDGRDDSVVQFEVGGRGAMTKMVD